MCDKKDKVFCWWEEEGEEPEEEEEEKMGGKVSACVQNSLSVCCNKSVYQIRVAGPAQAGKTSIIKWMKYRQFFKLAPTEGTEAERKP